MNCYVFFAEGFEEVEALTPVDVLRRAGFQVSMVSTNGIREISGSHGIIVRTDMVLESVLLDSADILILPGGMPGSMNLSKTETLSRMLIEHNKRGKTIAAICAAPFILGDLGILKGKQATCYPGYEDKLSGAEIKKETVVISDNIITGNGAGAAMKFSLAIVAKFKGDAFAKELAAKMMTTYSL